MRDSTKYENERKNLAKFWETNVHFVNFMISHIIKLFKDNNIIIFAKKKSSIDTFSKVGKNEPSWTSRTQT